MITVLREEPDFLVCLKEAGMDFHDSAEGPGFFSLLKAQRPGEILFPVHRLDKVTSGLILAARSREAAALLSRLIAGGGVEKVYLAISDRKPRRKQGWVIGDMLRSRRGQWKLSRERSNPARSYFYSRAVPGGRLFIVRIYTGKTHQIRVALKSLGAPILGDPLYNASGPEADRCYLHAWRLGFEWKGQRLNLESSPLKGRLFRDLPPDLATSFPVLP